MKIISLFNLSLLAIAPSIHAELVLQDNMDYGTSTITTSPVGSWASGSNRLSYNPTTNLSFAGDIDYVNASANSGTGSLERSSNVDNRFFSRDYTNTAQTGEVWLSMLMKPTTNGAATGEVVGLSLNTTGGLTLAGDLLGVGYDGSNLRPVWYDVSATSSTYASSTVTSGSTVLLLAKLGINVGADSFKMWMFYSSSSFGLTEAELGTAHLNSMAADFGDTLDKIQVGGIQGFQTNFDQIRISNLSGNAGLREVLTLSVVPEPTTALAGLLLTAGLLRRRRRNAEC